MGTPFVVSLQLLRVQLVLWQFLRDGRLDSIGHAADVGVAGLKREGEMAVSCLTVYLQQQCIETGVHAIAYYY